MFAMLAGATSLQSLYIKQFEIFILTAYDWNLDTDMAEVIGPVLSDKLAKFVLPSMHTWLEAMKDQGRDWKAVCSLAKDRDTDFDWDDWKNDDPTMFCKEIDRLIEVEDGAGIVGGVQDQDKWIWQKGNEHLSAKWLRNPRTLYRYHDVFYMSKMWTEE